MKTTDIFEMILADFQEERHNYNMAAIGVMISIAEYPELRDSFYDEYLDSDDYIDAARGLHYDDITDNFKENARHIYENMAISYAMNEKANFNPWTDAGVSYCDFI